MVLPPSWIFVPSSWIFVSPSWIFVLLVALCAPPAEAQTLEPIRYTISFPAPHTHYVEVEASVPTEGRPQIDLMMAVWTPGSYLVREYARHVEALTATDLRDPARRKNAQEPLADLHQRRAHDSAAIPRVCA